MCMQGLTTMVQSRQCPGTLDTSSLAEDEKKKKGILMKYYKKHYSENNESFNIFPKRRVVLNVADKWDH